MLTFLVSLALGQEQVVGGVPYRTMNRPSLVSIYSSLEGLEADTLHVTSLGAQASYKRCGGTSKARVIVMNHGIPTPVWSPPGVPSGFIEIYADLDGNGEPDPMPYKVLDSARQDGFYVTYRKGDNLQVMYLRDSGVVLEIPGYPLQTVWRKPTKRDNAASGITGCDMDPLEGYGGHRQLQASSLSRIL
jgi:hypothetical protein